MSEHKATVDWKRETPDFAYETYNRDHDWSFDAGVTVRASANPAYLGSERCVDPEEAFVAALSSCHLLTFLAIAARKGYVVDGYRDEAVGVLVKDGAGRLAITRVTLKPEVRFGGEEVPGLDQLRQLHDQAHHACFIANSVKTEVTVESLEPAEQQFPVRQANFDLHMALETLQPLVARYGRTKVRELVDLVAGGFPDEPQGPLLD